MENLIAPRWKPWQGKKYSQKKSAFGARILVLGESHYSKEKDLTNLTVRVVEQRKLKRIKNSTLVAIERTMEPFAESHSKKFNTWDHIAFCNYLQTWVGKTANDRSFSRGEYKKKANSDALIHTLFKLKPELVIILGTGLFKQIGEKQTGKPLRVGRLSYPTWDYDVGNGKTALAIGIKHPGKYYPTETWRTVIRAAINRVQRDRGRS